MSDVVLQFMYIICLCFLFELKQKLNTSENRMWIVCYYDTVFKSFGKCTHKYAIYRHWTE